MLSRFFQSSSACLLIASLLFSSCSHKKELILYAEMQNALNTSRQIIARTNEKTYTAIKEKTFKEETYERAQFWEPQARSISMLSDSIISYIEVFKKTIEKEAGLVITEKGTVDINASHIKNGGVTHAIERGKELHIRLQQYWTTLQGVDPLLFRDINELIDTTQAQFKTQQAFVDEYFTNNNTLSVLTFLSKFESDIVANEHNMLQYCYLKIGSTDGDGFIDLYKLLVSINRAHVHSGDEIEITAGLGSFEHHYLPVIKVNNALVQLKLGDGMGTYKYKVNGEPGRYTIPVIVEFFNQATSKMEGRKTMVEYFIDQ